MSSLILGRFAFAMRQNSLSARRCAALAALSPVSPKKAALVVHAGAARATVDQHGEIVSVLVWHNYGTRSHLQPPGYVRSPHHSEMKARSMTTLMQDHSVASSMARLPTSPPESA